MRLREKTPIYLFLYDDSYWECLRRLCPSLLLCLCFLFLWCWRICWLYTFLYIGTWICFISLILTFRPFSASIWKGSRQIIKVFWGGCINKCLLGPGMLDLRMTVNLRACYYRTRARSGWNSYKHVWISIWKKEELGLETKSKVIVRFNLRSQCKATPYLALDRLLAGWI